MKKTVVIALLLSFLLCGCSLAPASPEKAVEKAAAQMVAGDSAAQSGDYIGALKFYEAAEALTPTNMDTLRGQIAALKQLSAESEEYKAQLVTAYEDLYAADAFSEEDYLALAQLYISSGSFRQARDILEISQCLAPSEEKSALLDTLTVDVSSDSAKVQAALSPIFAKLASGDRDGAVDYILSVDLYSALCSRVASGSRRYAAKDGNGEVKLLVSDGCIDLWRSSSDGKVTLVFFSPDALFSGETSVKNGSYDGAFTAEYYKASNSSIVVDSGSFANGCAVGAATTETYCGEEAAELKELWNARLDIERTSYTGELDENGHTTAKAASGLEKGQIAYAYSEGGTQYVYIIAGEEDTGETFVFTPASFGFAPLPQW